MIRSLFVIVYKTTYRISAPKAIQILATDFMFSISQILNQEERDELGM